MSDSIAAAETFPGLWWGEFPDGEFQLFEIREDEIGGWVFACLSGCRPSDLLSTTCTGVRSE